MDFTPTETEQAIRGLAQQILGDLATPERLRALEAAGDWCDDLAWRALAEAEVLSMVLPETLGGGALGLTELAVLLEEVGRHAAPLPVLSTLAMGALPLARFGTPAQQSRWLGGVGDGTRRLTAAWHEPSPHRPLEPSTTASDDGEGWVLSGVKTCVPDAASAHGVLVPASTGPGSVRVFLVDPAEDRVSLEPQWSTHGEPLWEVTLSGVRVTESAILGAPDESNVVAAWCHAAMRAALCAQAVGLARQAMIITAGYTSTREQFGQTLSAFQAVRQRAGDMFIDVLCMEASAQQAVWRLDQDLPTGRELDVACWWACEGGHRVAAAAQHLHGGIGFDRDYPIHRYYLGAKHVEMSLGGASQQAAALGRHVAKAARKSR